jgi:hypothetical protein
VEYRAWAEWKNVPSREQAGGTLLGEVEIGDIHAVSEIDGHLGARTACTKEVVIHPDYPVARSDPAVSYRAAYAAVVSVTRWACSSINWPMGKRPAHTISV